MVLSLDAPLRKVGMEMTTPWSGRPDRMGGNEPRPRRESRAENRAEQVQKDEGRTEEEQGE